MLQKRSYHPIKGWHYVLMVLGSIGVFYSWKWSFQLASAMFGDVTGAFLATIVTVIEIVSLMQLILTMRLRWLVGVIPGFWISIAGSYGNFQMDYENSIAKSSEYQRMEQDIQTLTDDRNAALEAAQGYDKTKQPWYAKKNRQRADDLSAQIENKESQLKNMTDAGYGSSNALFRSIARHANISVLDSAERSNLVFGVLIECFMLFCTALSAINYKAGHAFVKANEQEISVTWDDDGNTIYTKNGSKHIHEKEQKKSPPQKFVPEPNMAQHKREIGFTPPSQAESEKKTELTRGTGEIISNERPTKLKYEDKSTAQRNESRKKTRRKNKIVELHQQNPNITVLEIMNAMPNSLQINSRQTVYNLIEELKREGRLK